MDGTPLLLLSSESDKARSEELEVDLTDQSIGISPLVPAPNTDNSILLGDRIEDAK